MTIYFQPINEIGKETKKGRIGNVILLKNGDSYFLIYLKSKSLTEAKHTSILEGQLKTIHGKDTVQNCSFKERHLKEKE